MKANNTTISQTAIDDHLFSLERCYIQHRGQPEGFRYLWLLFAINRHISTGRASTPWLHLFLASDPVKLAEHCKQYAGADDRCIEAVNRYLGYQPSA